MTANCYWLLNERKYLVAEVRKSLLTTPRISCPENMLPEQKWPKKSRCWQPGIKTNNFLSQIFRKAGLFKTFVWTIMSTWKTLTSTFQKAKMSTGPLDSGYWCYTSRYSIRGVEGSIIKVSFIFNPLNPEPVHVGPLQLELQKSQYNCHLKENLVDIVGVNIAP